MNAVQDHRKHHLLLILLISFFLVLTFPGLAKAETDTASTGAADTVTVSAPTASPAPAASETTGSVKASTETASVANDDSNSGKATSGLSPSGDNKPSLSPAEKPQANQTPASEKPDVTEMSTEKAQAGDVSQAEKDAKEKATASATDKEKTLSGDASQAEKDTIEKDTTGITDKEKASAGDPAQAEEEKTEKDETLASEGDTPKDTKAEASPKDLDAPQSPKEDQNTQASNDQDLNQKDPTSEEMTDLQKENEEAQEDSEKPTLVLEEGKEITLYQLRRGIPSSPTDVRVSTYDELVNAINAAKDNTPTTIVITKSFDITKTIVIPENKDIIITSGADRSQDKNKVTPIGQDKITDKITMPDEKDNMEKRQKLVKEAEGKGEKALKDTDLSKKPLPKVDNTIKRDTNFKGILIQVNKGGTLTLGVDAEDPLFIDGNKEVKTSQNASFIEVNGELVMNGGFIANGNNESGSSAPIYVGNGGNFTMNGGRITSNKNISKGHSTFNAAGAVYVDEGGQFTLNGGSIDNNEAPVGGVFLGKIFGNENGRRIPALFTMNGGFIVRNKGPLYDNLEPETENYGGGVHVDSLANFIFNNGIIAGNESYRGGAVAITDNYVKDSNGVNYSNIRNVNYEDYVKYAGAYYTQNGGLIYKNLAKIHKYPNTSGAGGGIYINSSNATLNGGYLLNNKSENMGGGIYLSIAPHVLKLEHVLISQNKAVKGGHYHLPAGDGGGFWNCPVGNVNFEDFNSIYIFENEAVSTGKDIVAHLKKDDYWIYNEKSYEYPKFTTKISPITEKGNIIKYVYDGTKVPEWMYNTNKSVYLEAIYDAQTKEEAWTNSNLFIMGNTALKGGGIGSNASIIPPGKPGKYEITINKNWHKSIPEDKKPGSIWVDLFIGDAKYGEVELNKANDWTAKFENLPFTAEELMEKKIKYSIKERNDDFYSVVDEALKALEVERVFAGEKYPDNKYASDYDKPYHKFMDYKIVFIHKDKNGNEVSREDIKIRYNDDKWSGIVQDMLVGKFKDPKDIKITYHSYDKAYEPSPDWAGLGFNGLDADSNWYNDGGWHEAYILEKEDGSVEIQLPYLWTMYMGNPDGTTDDYYKNTTGYKLNLVPNHRFSITNYPYSEIPVVKRWDKSIKEKDIPDSVKVYLLKDGKRVKDKEGKDRYIILSKENEWKGNFDRLPYFELEGMGFEKYWVKEDSEIFIPLVTRKENSILNIEIERDKDSNKYLIYKDYTGGTFRIEYIPFEVHYLYKDGDKEVKDIYTKKLKPYRVDGWKWQLDTVIKDILMHGKFNASDIKIKMYYDENGKPFPRNLGKYQASWDDNDIVTNDGAYILKLLEENGKLVLYVPKLTDVGDEDNLLNVNTRIEDGKKYFELTNHYLPKHRLEIEKVWDVINSSSIPKNLKVKVEGKYVDKEVTLTPEEWKYVEEFLGKGLLATNKYAFTEEELANFNGTQSIETSLEFTAKDKTVTFLDQDGKAISQEDFLKLVKGEYYSFELKEAAADKAEVEIKYDAEGKLVIVYPVDVTITEVAKVLFKNTENPPGGTPGSNTRIIRVTKAWDLAGHEKPVSEITVELYRDGQATGRQLTLNADNNWTSSFAGLEIADKANPAKKYQYTIKEVSDVNGLFEAGGKKFEVSYTGNMFTGFTITNKEIPEEPPETPEEPPKTPEEPPVTPPETPEEPPVTPPETPEEPPVVPQTPPTVPEAPGKAPQTGLPANGAPFLLMAMGLVGLRLTRRRKRTDGQ